MNTNKNLNEIKIVSSKMSAVRGGAADTTGNLRRTVAEYDDVMMKWINASDANKQKFMKDPVGCFNKVAAPGAEAINLLSNAAPIAAEEMPICSDVFKMKTFAADKAAAADLADSSVSVHGWDIVSAIKIEKLNGILSMAYDKGLLPTSFQSDIKLKIFGISVTISLKGTIGVLSVYGGSGEDIDIKVPVTSLSVDSGESSITCNTDLIITVNLECVETTRADNSTVYTYYLKLGEKAVTNATAENVPNEIIKLFGGKEVFAGILKQKILEAANNASIKICEINSADIKAQYKFLIPKSAKYYFKQFPNMGDSILAILIQTTSEKQGVRTVDDNVIPDSCDGSLIIENELFLKNVLMDQIAPACNTNTDNLGLRRLTNIAGSPYEIYNKAPFDYKKVDDYTPKIINLTFSEYQEKLYIHMDAIVTPTAGINLKYHADGQYTASFKDGAKEQEFVLNEISFDSDHDLEIEWWVWTVAALTGLVAIWTAGPVVAAIISGLSVGIAAAVGAIISGVAPSGLEASVFTSAVDTVKWNYADIVSFKNVGLFGDIRLGVTIPMLNK